MDTEGFYLQLRERLANGEWLLGQRLPSIRKFVDAGQASYHSVVASYQRLASEGLIASQQGRGYFVAMGSAPCDTRDVEPRSGDPLMRLMKGGAEYVKLGCGWLPAAWRDTDLLAKAIRRTARLERSSLAEYGDVSGYLPLRRQLCTHMKRLTRIDLPPSQLLTTLGATQALDLVLRLLVRPGDRVMVDEPGNGNLIKLVQLAGGIAVGIPRTQEGPDIAAVEQALAEGPVRAFVCNSTFHNPTGGSLAPHNAFKLLRLSLAHDFRLIEDDVYGDFSLTPRQTLAELDNLERVIYIGSFAKCLSASLRVGFIAASAELIDALTELKLLTSVAVPAFCERFVNTILGDGTYQGHVKHLQQQLLTRQTQTQRALLRHGWRFDIVPDGGMFIWAYHPDMPDLAPFIARLERQGILLMPGSSFAVARPYGHLTRINCTHFTGSVEACFAP